MPGLRLDLQPESYAYRDNGCAVARSCLRCPLPRCNYDDPNERRREARDRRDGEMLAVRRLERLTVPELAVRFGVSERTVFRAVQRERDNGNVKVEESGMTSHGGKKHGEWSNWSTPTHTNGR